METPATVTRLLPWAALLVMGAAWGLSFSFARIVVQAGGTPFGVTFWQSVVCGVILLTWTMARRRPLPMTRRHLGIYVIVALLGASVPNSLFYFAAPHVQAGVLSITVTLIPIITYAVAMLLGTERMSAIRMTGVVCGAVAIGFLVVPESSLPSRAAMPWVLLACISAACYALENIYLARPSLQDIGPVRTACGMNLFAAMIMLPVAVLTDQMFLPAFPLGTVEWTVIGLGLINAVAYTTFVMVIGLAGPVFASQTGYVVTLAGVVWGIILFGETHSAWVWASVGMMMLGLALVTPRRRAVPGEDDKTGKAA
ncbi:MAG: DMT family transporter [Pseudomonadota bacterium]|nr:DMT family transporter [Pseudomonadota bacterium]